MPAVRVRGVPGQLSTSISQPVISTESMISCRLNTVHQGTTTSIFFAFRKGRSPGSSPSITRSSTTKTPGLIFADSRPMCIGRSEYFDPSLSARARNEGPRSTVKTVTMMPETIATTSASSRSP